MDDVAFPCAQLRLFNNYMKMDCVTTKQQQTTTLVEQNNNIVELPFLNIPEARRSKMFVRNKYLMERLPCIQLPVKVSNDMVHTRALSEEKFNIFDMENRLTEKKSKYYIAGVVLSLNEVRSEFGIK